ncbi:hypothetical protein [Candidatus Nitrospira bockiana]
MNQYFARKHVNVGDAVYAGVLAGLLAGVAMAMVSMMMSMMTGQGFWMPVKKISVTLLGQSTVQDPGFQMMPVMVGMMIHFATAIMFGVIFALWGGRWSYGPAIGWGIAYGLAIWVVMQFAVLPIVNPVMAEMPYLQFAMLHVIFGGTLGSYPAFLPSESESRAKALRSERAA